ncbi:hypothetical protein ESZ50_04865 [Weissella muntiaci]|uniref:Uncharacterized protein n=1 Tax=Weissella muntiaci TaxID=2508881 RepID=A0A6C2C7N6_9LACO|nr:hypothetical protein [Weissella muntiaci]TYC49924.1 hypothetical protein ESZ50_04865 [Weissella muntiaci]
MEDHFQKLSEDMNKLVKPDLELFDSFTLQGPYSLNGYVVVPNSFPLDYVDEFYSEIDDQLIGGLTYSGYAVVYDGELSLLSLDNSPWLKLGTVELSENDRRVIKQVKNNSVRVLGFDDAHIDPNELDVKEGAEDLAKQLKLLLPNCAVCNNPITEEYLMVGDNYLQVKYFDDEESNIFCSEDCLMKSLSVLSVYIDSE